MSKDRVWFPGWQFASSALEPLMARLPDERHHRLSFAGERGHWNDWLSHQHLAIPEQSHLVGWSLGGMLALEAARHRPDVASVTLLCANVRFAGEPCGLPETVAEDFRRRYRDRRDTARRRFLNLVEGRPSTDSLADHLLEGDQSVTLDWLYELDLSQDWVACPVRVLLARDDQLVPVDAAARAWIDLGAEVKLLPGGHDLPWRDPDAVADWMRRHD